LSTLNTANIAYPASNNINVEDLISGLPVYFVAIDGSASSIVHSYNVSSLTDNATGLFVINLTNSYTSTNNICLLATTIQTIGSTTVTNSAGSIAPVDTSSSYAQITDTSDVNQDRDVYVVGIE
jgi:hypothetical protein